MTECPDVTIVMPVGGAAADCGLPGVLRSLASIGADPRVQILAVPCPGAPDGAAAWLAARAADDPRLTVLDLALCADAAAADLTAAGPGGMARARNGGIAVAAAPLVAFLDPGDVWLPGKLSAQRALHAGHPAIGFSFTDARRIGTSGREGGRALAGWPRFRERHGRCASAFLLGADAQAQLSDENLVVTSTVVARTDLLREVGGFVPGIAAPEYNLWLRLAELAPVACRPEATAQSHRSGRPQDAPAPLAALADIIARRLRAAWRQDPRAARGALRPRLDRPARPA